MEKHEKKKMGNRAEKRIQKTYLDKTNGDEKKKKENREGSYNRVK